MTAYSPILTTIVAAIVLAFVFGVLAHWLRLPLLVGFIAAGMVTGAYIFDGHVNSNLATQIYDVGLVMLMFGTGLHFSVAGLRSVKHIAIPGAIVQCIVIVALGVCVGLWQTWSVGQGLLIGLAMSTASVIVLLAALNAHRLTETERGRITIGWLTVQDLMVATLLLVLPVLAGLSGSKDATLISGSTFNTVFFLFGKVAMFALAMVILGKRIVPWILSGTFTAGSRELRRLAVVALALGFALGTAYIFGIPFALGAFFAGIVLSATELSSRVALDTLPLREVFSVVFFVGIGMLFNLASVLTAPLVLLAILGIILLGKPLVALLIVRLYRYSWTTALTVAASLAQIGEFSLIIAALGLSFKLFSPIVGHLILAGAIISILANPLLMYLLPALGRRMDGNSQKYIDIGQVAVQQQENRLRNHVIVVGYGRVGYDVVEGLQRAGTSYIVIDDHQERIAQLRVDGMSALFGNATDARILEEAKVMTARSLIVVIPDALETTQVVEQALTLHPKIQIIAYARTDAEAMHLQKHGVAFTVVGEHEIANAILDAFMPPSSS